MRSANRQGEMVQQQRRLVRARDLLSSNERRIRQLTFDYNHTTGLIMILHAEINELRARSDLSNAEKALLARKEGEIAAHRLDQDRGLARGRLLAVKNVRLRQSIEDSLGAIEEIQVAHMAWVRQWSEDVDNSNRSGLKGDETITRGDKE